MIEKIKDPKLAGPLFHGWNETMIWSCLQGVMGEIYADDRNDPGSVMAILGDFCFFAGRPDKELVLYKPEWFLEDFIIMVPQNEEWAELIETCYKEKAKKVERYAIKKESNVFEKEKLEQFVAALPKEYSLKEIDETLYHKCRTLDWCADWVSQYAEYEDYKKYGLGVVVLKDGEPVSGASSYTSYQGGIEIEIDTDKAYRRQGLASACGAKLILKCMERNIYPSWDAQNKWSVALAQKLGYHYSHTYAAYEIGGY